jgi:hypothetical protein
MMRNPLHHEYCTHVQAIVLRSTPPNIVPIASWSLALATAKLKFEMVHAPQFANRDDSTYSEEIKMNIP